MTDCKICKSYRKDLVQILELLQAEKDVNIRKMMNDDVTKFRILISETCTDDCPDIECASEACVQCNKSLQILKKFKNLLSPTDLINHASYCKKCIKTGCKNKEYESSIKLFDQAYEIALTSLLKKAPMALKKF